MKQLDLLAFICELASCEAQLPVSNTAHGSTREDQLSLKTKVPDFTKNPLVTTISGMIPAFGCVTNKGSQLVDATVLIRSLPGHRQKPVLRSLPG